MKTDAAHAAADEATSPPRRPTRQQTFDRVPALLRARSAWLIWRFEPSTTPGGKPRKVPHYANGGRRQGEQGAPDDRAGLVNFDDAIAACAYRGFDGVGLAMLPGLGLVALDFDDCADANNVRAEVLDVVMGTYAEYSPSGKGVRAFYLGSLADRKDHGAEDRFAVEVFSGKGFVTVTGNVLPECEMFGHEQTVALLTPEVLSLYEHRFGDARSSRVATTATAPRDPLDMLGEVTAQTIIDLRSAVAWIIERDSQRADSYDSWAEFGLALKSLEAAGYSGEAAEMWHLFSAASPRYDAKEATRKWDRDIKPSRITYRSIFEWAQRCGWRNPSHAATTVADEPALSDVHLSRLLAALLAGRFLYEHGGRGWLIYREGAWRACAVGEVNEEAKRLGAAILKDAADGDTDKIARAMKLATRAMSAGGISAALSLAESDPRTAVAPDAFDLDPDSINVRNGVVHLPSGELRQHDPALRMSRQCAVAYDPAAPCPQWLRFLDEISKRDPDWIDYLQRLCGYVLSGYVREEVMAFFLGIGANGKSVLANVLRRLMGSYAVSVPPAFLMLSQRDGEGATPALATLPGARLALANEIEAGARLSAQSVKVACSTEAIAARHLYGRVFSFVPTHKLIVRGNHKPIITDNDEGIWRRIHLIPFDRHFGPEEKDALLEDKLMTEASGILAWMVAGYGEYLRRGLRPARRVAAASASYRHDSDLIGQWIEDHVEIGAFEVGQAPAYSDYRAWCLLQGLNPIAKKSLTRNLAERRIGERQRGGGQRERLYVGMRIAAGQGVVDPFELCTPLIPEIKPEPG